MEDKRGDFIVIVAGYTDNMKQFLESNPGLSSRFDREMNFADYSAEQLYLIAIKMLQGNSIIPDPKAAEYLKNYLTALHAGRNKFFGNARNVRKIIEEVIKNQHLRLAKLSQAERTSDMINTIFVEDVEEFKIEENPSANKRSIGFNQNS
jgi:hypothetical protein